MTLCIVLGEFLIRCWRERNRKVYRRIIICWFLLWHVLFWLFNRLFSFDVEQATEVRLNSKARFHGLLSGIGCHFGPIKV